MSGKDSIAANLKTIRMALKISEEALAIASGISKETISRYERGVANPTVDTLERLSKALNINIGDFFLIIDNKIMKEIQQKALSSPTNVNDFFGINITSLNPDKQLAIKKVVRIMYESMT